MISGMVEIYDTKRFPFEQVDLGTPFNKNGSYFLKIQVGEHPLYIQPPKCCLKQGLLKSGKKVFCDLMFDIEDNTFLAWMETIEEIAKKKIYENRAKWFETELDEHDIENSMTSAYKMYKSGKMYIVRANIPTTLGKNNLKIYDEQEREVAPEDLKDDAQVITILEWKGIKCSVRSFQFDVDVRQMLLVSPVKIFETCLIKKTGTTPFSAEGVVENTIGREAVMDEEEKDLAKMEPSLLVEPVEEEPSREISREISPLSCEEEEEETPLPREEAVVVADPPTTPENPWELCEIDLDLEKMTEGETVQLKKRNEVYYTMYKEAKRKAKEAKMLALSNYLEAKRIKTTYLLDDSSEDEDDLLNDLDEED